MSRASRSLKNDTLQFQPVLKEFQPTYAFYENDGGAAPGLQPTVSNLKNTFSLNAASTTTSEVEVMNSMNVMNKNNTGSSIVSSRPVTVATLASQSQQVQPQSNLQITASKAGSSSAGGAVASTSSTATATNRAQNFRNVDLSNSLSKSATEDQYAALDPVKLAAQGEY